MKKLLLIVPFLISISFGQIADINSTNPNVYNQQMNRLFGNWASFLADPSVDPNGPTTIYKTSQYGGDVDATAVAMKAATDNGTLYINSPAGTAIMSTGVTLTATEKLVNDPNCYITGTGSPTLTINGQIEYDTFQKFDSTVTVAFGDSVRIAYPEWFYAYGAATDATTAFQAAVDAFGSKPGIVRVQTSREYLVTSTISTPTGVVVEGEFPLAPLNSQTVPTWAPKITFDPTIDGDNLFELTADAAAYVFSVGIRNMAIIGVNDGTVGALIYWDKPGNCRVENCFLLNCEDAISISRGLNNKITNCNLQSFTADKNIGFEIRDAGTGVTTTTTVDGCYFSGFAWSSVLEFANSTLFTGKTIFESASSGGVDIQEKCGLTEFTNCYSEDIPSGGGAKPIIQVGVNGTGSDGHTCKVVVSGGEWAGVNGSVDPNSSFMNIDKSNEIVVTGAFITRVGTDFITTANTLLGYAVGNSGSSITGAGTQILDKHHWLGTETKTSTIQDTSVFNVNQLRHSDGANYMFQEIAGGKLFWGNASGNYAAIDATGLWSFGDATPVADAQVAINSTTGAFLLPRMTTTQRDALTPTNGMVIYNTTTTQIEGYENGSWVDL